MLDPDLLEEFGVRVGDVVRVKLLSFVPSVLWLKQSHDNDRKLFKDLKFDMHEFFYLITKFNKTWTFYRGSY